MPTFLESLILKIFPSMDRFWEVFRFLACRGRMLPLRVCPAVHIDGVRRSSAAGLCADRFYDLPHCELHPLCLCGLSCRKSEYEADGALYCDVSPGAGAESACHVVLHRPSWDMVYVFKGRGFCDRDDLELFH